MNQLEDFLTPTQNELFLTLGKMFGKRTISKKGCYILVPGAAPVMLVAHLDTVHCDRVKQICKSESGNILMSPQGIGGDDRCGVYALVMAHKLSEVKPWLLFTCDEETGGKGASAFCTQHEKGKLPKGLDSLKAIVEVDRRGRNDAVYYDCGNEEFEEYITGKGFETECGSFSDISFIAPELGVAAVNLSAGYYDAHTRHEHIDRRHLNATIKKVVEIVSDAAKEGFPKYEYVERTYRRSLLSYGRYDYFWDWDSDSFGLRSSGNKFQPDRRKPDLSGDEDETLDRKYDKYGVPYDLRDVYDALLDFYSFDELEEYRYEFGDRSVLMLYESEFGEPYYAVEDDSDADVK